MNISALKIFWGPALAAQVLLLALVAGAPGVMAQEQDPDHPGRKIYDDMCSQCHGGMGDAKSHGFEAMYPRPRDFTSGMFKFRRTGSGEYPLEKDLVQMITNGMPGTAMPPWGHVLKPDEIRLVAQYIQKFYASPDDEPLEEKKITKAPQATPELIRQGRQVFEKLECFRCHGQEGRGDGYNSMVLREDWNQEPIYPRNLTAGWLFRGGREPEDIYRTVLFGLNGTPMPAHSEEAALKEEQARWALAHYIRSISGSTQEPAVKSNIISKFTEGPVPVGGAHPVWEEAEVYYIPLAAQVVVEPRLYQPSVRQLWVQSLYNDYEIGLKVRWTDSTTQDNAAIKEALKKRETDEGLEPGSLQPPADEMSIQFPSNYEIGRTLPYFLMGRPGNSVNLWQFKSGEDRIVTAKASGLNRVKEDGEMSKVSGKITYKDGMYTMVVKRRRITGKTGEAQFVSDPGIIPISFLVADGFKGEGGTRQAVATWYNLLLEKRVGGNVFYMPLLVMLVIIGFQRWLVKTVREQEKERV